MKTNQKEMTGRDFDALPDAEKERIFRECEQIGPDAGRPLTTAELARHRRIQRKMGRPRIGKGAARVNVTIERGLLAQADRFARQQGMTRAELIAVGLKRAMAG